MIVGRLSFSVALGAAALWLGAFAIPPLAAQIREDIATSADEAERATEALAVATIFQPRELVIQSSIAQLDRDFVKTILATPDFAMLEEQYPGFSQAYWDAAKPHAVKMLQRRHPDLVTGMAKIYAARLTLAELRSMRAFFSGPTGQKVISSMHGGSDVKAMLTDAAQRPDWTISSQGFEASVRGSVRAIRAALSETEEKEFVAFMMTAAGRKMSLIAPEMQRFGIGWMNAADPEYDAVMERTAMEVLQRLDEGK